MLREELENPLNSFQVGLLTVQIYPTAAAVAAAASAIARNILQAAIDQQGAARAIFATGRSQVAFLARLTSPETALDWSCITGFHLDEYLGIASEHPASFRQYLITHLAGRVTLGQWHSLEGDGLEPIRICQDYANRLQVAPIDLCCLGIGNNGHLAFNDPAVANFEDPYWVKLVRLDARNRQQQVEAGSFPHLEAVPQYAFTLTLSAICAARHKLCLAVGETKANILKTLLQGPIAPHCPATILRATSGATLLVDQAAASQL